MSDFQNRLDHSHAAYRAAVTWCLVAKERGFPFDLRGLRFESESQLQSVIVELGWAFEPRFFAILEQYYKANGFEKFVDFKDKYLNNKFDPESVRGFVELSKLRQIILHGDGDEQYVWDGNKLGVPEGCEPHILPEHVEKLYRLLTSLFSAGGNESSLEDQAC
ncbi:MAG TPA: hypothetical protein VFF88_03185 [Methylocella sp.]|nr:hypothetical protein [Methylocella sp.]